MSTNTPSKGNWTLLKIKRNGKVSISRQNWLILNKLETNWTFLGKMARNPRGNKSQSNHYHYHYYSHYNRRFYRNYGKAHFSFGHFSSESNQTRIDFKYRGWIVLVKGSWCGQFVMCGLKCKARSLVFWLSDTGQ